jgi:hypothetical protein
MIIALLVMWLLLMALTVAYWIVGSRIVRHVVTREGGKYSIFWPLNPRWHFEMGQLSWFGEAQDAGYGRALLAIYVAMIVLLASFVYLPFKL